MKLILAALLFLTLVNSARTQDFVKGQDAFERGDYATALQEWRPLAEQGNADAQYKLGVMYGKLGPYTTLPIMNLDKGGKSTSSSLARCPK